MRIELNYEKNVMLFTKNRYMIKTSYPLDGLTNILIYDLCPVVLVPDINIKFKI